MEEEENVRLDHFTYGFFRKRPKEAHFRPLPLSKQHLSTEELGDVKANSINEWVAVPAVRRSIAYHFQRFLETCTDEHLQSIYGARILILGQSKSSNLCLGHLTQAFS
jgi:hypothetical protein